MADRFYGLDRGETEDDVVDQATTPAKDYEFAIDLVTAGTLAEQKAEALRALDIIKNIITRDDWPPA